jgi:hypothetical protein
MIALSCRLVNVTPPGGKLMLVCVVPDRFTWTDATSNAPRERAAACRTRSRRDDRRFAATTEP